MLYALFKIFIISFFFFFLVCRDGINTNGPVNAVEMRWEQTNGPYGGQALSSTVTKNGTLLISGEFGVYISKDNGDNWSLSSLKGKTIRHLFSGPNSEIMAASDDAVYISNDDGNIWIEKNIPSNYQELQGIQNIISYKNGTILLLTYGKILLSSANNGNSWQQYSIPVKSYIYTAGINSKGRIFIGTYEEGIFCSKDKGNSWQQLDTNVTGKYIRNLSIDGNDILYLNSNLLKFSKSTDDGLGWLEINNNIPERNFSILKKIANGFFLAGTSSKIYISTNEGQLWNTVDLLGAYPSSIIISNDNVLFLYIGGGGLLRSKDNGFNWEDVNKGILNSTVSFISVDKYDNIYAQAGGSRLLYSTDKGNNWLKVPGPYNGYYVGEIFITKNNYILTLSYEAGIYKSTDNGVSWKQKIDETLNSNNHPFSFKEDSRGNLYALSSMGSLLHSANGGENWENLKLPCFGVALLEIDGKDNLYIMSGYPYDDVIDRINRTVYTSTNYGRDWIIISNIPEDFSFHAAADSKRNLYLVSGRNLYRIKGIGSRWKTEIILKSESFFSDVEVDKKDNLFVLSDYNRIYLSSDEGYSWRKSQFPLSETDVYCIETDSKGNIYLGSSNKGVYRSSIVQ